MKTFVIGDIHGNYKGLMQCLERSNFDYENDKLIQLGDVCDGWHEVKECFNELLKIKNRVDILGNHDWWARQYYLGKLIDPEEQKLWTTQGGKNTLASYGYKVMDEEHLKILQEAKLWHLEKDGKVLFVHGGCRPDVALEKQKEDMFLWDRDLVYWARRKDCARPQHQYGGYESIFVGHTTTQAFKCKGVPILEPLRICNIVMMDTGGGWDGKVSIMDVDSGEFWQSDLSKDLYPNHLGRRG